MGSINKMLKKSDNFESLIDEKLSMLNIWIKKIERSNKPYYIPRTCTATSSSSCTTST
jgi:hypothetical protein